MPFHQGQQSQNVVPYHQYRFHRLAHRLAKIQAALGWGEDLLLSVQAPISTTTSQLDLAPHTDVPSPGKRNVGWLSTLPGSFNYVFSNMVPTFSYSYAPEICIFKRYISLAENMVLTLRKSEHSKMFEKTFIHPLSSIIHKKKIL